MLHFILNVMVDVKHVMNLPEQNVLLVAKNILITILMKNIVIIIARKKNITKEKMRMEILTAYSANILVKIVLVPLIIALFARKDILWKIIYV